MAGAKKSQEPVDWDALELQAFNLKFEPLSTEDLLQKARDLAAAFKIHHEPLPGILEQIPNLIIENHYTEPCEPE